MEHKEKGDNRTFAAVIRTILMVFLFAAVLLFTKNPVYADSDVALTVQKDGQTLKEFTLEELQQIAIEEGSVTYDFTAWNTYPTFKEYKGAHGPTIAGLLEASEISVDSIEETWTISFMDKENGGYKKSLTGKQLLEDRYYYPNGRLMDPKTGVLNDEAYSDAVKVPAIVSLSDVVNEFGETVDKGRFKLYVGQVAPNEENNPLFVDNLAAGGFINVSTEPAPKCEPVTADPENLTVWREGKEITLTSKNNYEYDKIYFTVDETDPDYGSQIYNCAPKQDIELKPVISGDTRFVLKTVVKGYGKQDSDIQRFVYNIGEPLTVKLNGEILKTYDRDELKSFAGIDAGGLDYSGYNSFPTLHVNHIDQGYRVDRIIEDASGKDVSEFDSISTVKFTSSDGYSALFTIGQLFGSERFYYPNAEKGTNTTGGMAQAAAYTDRKSVPAIIEGSRESQFLFGQIAPNEQNHAEFVSYMLQGGVIDIDESPAEKCDPVPEPSPADGSLVGKGEEIRFAIPDTYKNRRDKLYYIIDPADNKLPGSGSAIYFYGPYHWPEEKINPPVIKTAGHHTIAARVMAYGKQDSDVRVFDFYVRPDVPAGLKGTVNTYNSAKLTWKAIAGASGYRIYRAVSGGTLVKYKDIKAGQTSFTDKGLVCGKTYQYAISALAEGRDGTLESGKSGKVKVKPVPGKTTVKLVAGKRQIKVQWNKVSGASGYVIMRSTKKTSGFRTVKTIKKGSTVSYVNKKLKKGKRYYYKIRAYRTVSGKKIYGSYSEVKTTRSK